MVDHSGARPLSRADPSPEGGETPDDSGAFPRLGGAQLETLSAHGERRPTKVGDLLFREGDASYDFFVILEGKVAIVAGYGHEERLIALHGPGRFLGELNLLIGHAVYLTGEVREPGEVLVVPAARLREIVAQDQELSDTILRAFVLRRSILVGLGAGIKLVGSRFGRESRRLREFVARNRIPHAWLDVEEDVAADALLREFGIEPADTPVVIRGEEVLRNPTNAELAGRLGLGTGTRSREVCDLAVVGAGPAGLAAAVYGASEGLATVVVEAVATGGQAATSSRIENYLGFPAGISGSELAARAAIQADKFGAAIRVPVEAVGLTERGGYHALRLDDQSDLLARTVVLATGARYRRLRVPRISDLEGVGVYHAATQMEAQLCGDGPVVVVGGGNAAGQAALFLAERCDSVQLLVRGDDLSKSMSRYLADQLEREPNIEVRRRTQVRELRGDQALEGVVVEDGQGARVTLETNALFLMIGADPNTEWLAGELALDEDGFVLTGRESPTAAPHALAKIGRAPFVLEASRPGVFAAGDVRRGSIKRVASAVGEGSMAVRLVHQHLLEPSGRPGAPVSATPTGG